MQEDGKRKPRSQKRTDLMTKRVNSTYLKSVKAFQQSCWKTNKTG